MHIAIYKNICIFISCLAAIIKGDLRFSMISDGHLFWNIYYCYLSQILPFHFPDYMCPHN